MGACCDTGDTIPPKSPQFSPLRCILVNAHCIVFTAHCILFNAHCAEDNSQSRRHTLIKMPRLALSKILHLSQFNRYPGFVKTGSVQMSPKIVELIVLCGREGGGGKEGWREGGISSLSAVAVTEDSSPSLPLC